MQLTSVNPVPFNSAGIALATKLENCGESAVTAIPHKHHPIKNSTGGSWNMNGDKMQKIPEINNEKKATL